MPTFEVRVRHNLTIQEAVSRMKSLLSDLKQENMGRITEVTERWRENCADFSFRASGFQVTGRIVVQADEVVIPGNLPWMLGGLKDKLEVKLKERIQAALDNPRASLEMET